MSATTIQIVSGKFLDPLNLKPEDIEIEDIARSLSKVCRFNGHSKDFYSVAQHSVLVSYIVPPEFALAGLMHDASEYIIADIASPVKPVFSNYYEVESHVMSVIAEKFGFAWPLPAPVRHADMVLLKTEKRDLLPQHPDDDKFWVFPPGVYPLMDTIYPMDHNTATHYFLSRFHGITGEKREKSRGITPEVNIR